MRHGWGTSGGYYCQWSLLGFHESAQYYTIPANSKKKLPEILTTKDGDFPFIKLRIT